MSQGGLLPREPDPEVEDAEPRLVDLCAGEADGVLDALGCETARAAVSELCADPATKSELADRLDTSIQNAHYHLERLHEAGLVRVVGTHYSSRGTEMDVYAPGNDPLVLVAGDENTRQAVASQLPEGAPDDSPSPAT